MPALENARGTIVNISSVAGLVGSSFRTTYSASKFAIAGFSKALRPEVKSKGVKVLMVYPGYVKTGVSKNALTGNKDERLGKTDSNIANGMNVDDCCR
jgi:short-subunit dehydrogenase